MLRNSVLSDEQPRRQSVTRDLANHCGVTVHRFFILIKGKLFICNMSAHTYGLNDGSSCCCFFVYVMLIYQRHCKERQSKMSHVKVSAEYSVNLLRRRKKKLSQCVYMNLSTIQRSDRAQFHSAAKHKNLLIMKFLP